MDNHSLRKEERLSTYGTGKIMRILRTLWFTNRDGTTGIVHVQTDYDGLKYFIGHVSGEDESVDSQYVADWGSTFPTDAGDVLFGLSRVEQPDFDGPLIKMFRD